MKTPPKHHPETHILGPELRAAFGPGYQVPLDAARVVQIVKRPGLHRR